MYLTFLLFDTLSNKSRVATKGMGVVILNLFLYRKQSPCYWDAKTSSA